MSEDNNPMKAAQRLARPELPRRFYKAALAGAHDGGFAVLLDGKPVRTPGRKPFAVSDRRVAEALAAEWEAQAERIDPATMPLTRLVNSAIDRVAGEMAAVRAEIVKYAGNDLICYRAEGPQPLIDAQAAAWDPLVDWAREALGVRLVLAAGIVHAAQDEALSEAVDRMLQPLDPLALAAVSSATTLTGSAVVALALLSGRLSADQAWAAACVDEDWQMSQWGEDAAALAQRDSRKRELDAAGLVLGARKPA